MRNSRYRGKIFYKNPVPEGMPLATNTLAPEPVLSQNYLSEYNSTLCNPGITTNCYIPALMQRQLEPIMTQIQLPYSKLYRSGSFYGVAWNPNREDVDSTQYIYIDTALMRNPDTRTEF
ncbi:unnamed protein product [Phytomonas sp. Hart1]|nr:unnamed protein product [Phytomonas sp. Hart1]|eukprot:CCW66390.1 unnamed protein product [Phytomonas sp. isolate Hart1]